MLTTEKCGTRGIRSFSFLKDPLQKSYRNSHLSGENKTVFEAILWFPTVHETGVVLGSACSNRSHTKFHTTDEATRQQVTQTESVWHHELVRIRFCCKATINYCLLKEWNVHGSLNRIALVFIVISSSINITLSRSLLQISVCAALRIVPHSWSIWMLTKHLSFRSSLCLFSSLFSRPASILRSSSSFWCFGFCFSFLHQSSFCLKSFLLLLLHLSSFRFCLFFLLSVKLFPPPTSSFCPAQPPYVPLAKKLPTLSHFLLTFLDYSPISI